MASLDQRLSRWWALQTTATLDLHLLVRLNWIQSRFSLASVRVTHHTEICHLAATEWFLPISFIPLLSVSFSLAPVLWESISAPQCFEVAPKSTLACWASLTEAAWLFLFSHRLYFWVWLGCAPFLCLFWCTYFLPPRPLSTFSEFVLLSNQYLFALHHYAKSLRCRTSLAIRGF